MLFTTGRRYLYHDVPQAAADEFRAAFSKGRYFNAHIRDAYDYTECVCPKPPPDEPGAYVSFTKPRAALSLIAGPRPRGPAKGV